MSDDQAIATVSDILKANKDRLRLTLPRHMDPDRFMTASLNLLRQQPALMTCSPQSFFGALIQAAALGLEPGPLNHIYLLPFWNNKTNIREVQLIPSYKGLCYLAMQSKRVTVVRSYPVYEHDQFCYELGLEPSLTHKPAIGNPGAIIAFYAYARLENGEPLISVMSKDDVDRHRDRFSKAAKDGPWVTNYIEMGCKTAIRKALKLAPISNEIEMSIALDELAESRISQNLAAPNYEWTGATDLDWQDNQPTPAETQEAEEADVILLPNFGKYANQSVRKPPTKILQSYCNTIEKSIKDPSKKSWQAKNEQALNAIQEEIARRCDVEALLPKDDLERALILKNFGLESLDKIDWGNDETVESFRVACLELQPKEKDAPTA